MPQDFDAKRQTRIDADRDFIIGGETLTYRASVKPETMIAWSKVQAEGGDEESLPKLDALVKEFVTDESYPKWEKIRAVSDDYALNLEDVTDVIEFLVQQQTGRPTEASSGSALGLPTTQIGTTSMGSSPSPAATPPPSLSAVSAT